VKTEPTADELTAEGRTMVSDRDPSSGSVSHPLPLVSLSVTPGDTADFELAETLGQGGMGQVVSATQRALLRPVALKFSRDDAGRQALLREAIATGRLEHPNIVPVHLLASTSEGVPFFAMKRVEGTPWSAAISTRALVDNLETLNRVCDAVAFAHDRQIIHRDLKPSNVMLGRFGEVYVVDWALAVSLRPDAVLPQPSEGGLAGTPAYMAPEMVIDPIAVDTRTDIYLLGAVLHEILTGRPPHRAPTPEEAITSAARGDAPMFDGTVPEELANICRRAMSKFPPARFATVIEFKSALTGYLRHQEASAVYQTASQQLVELEGKLKAGDSSEAVHALFSECRFGFEQVRRLWPEFVGARDRLHQTLVAMARSELRRGALDAARLLVSQLESPAPADLLKELELAEAAERAKDQRLDALERHAKDNEVDAASNEKSGYSRVFGITLILVACALQAANLYWPGWFKTWMGVPFALLLLANTLTYGVVLRRAPDLNRRALAVYNALLGNDVAGLSMWVVAWLDELPILSAIRFYLLINAVSWGVPALLEERRALIIAVAFLLAIAASYAAPGWIMLFGGLFGGVGLLVVSHLLARVQRRS
jgi:predicted Ser/Thr protein kinase